MASTSISTRGALVLRAGLGLVLTVLFGSVGWAAQQAQWIAPAPNARDDPSFRFELRGAHWIAAPPPEVLPDRDEALVVEKRYARFETTIERPAELASARVLAAADQRFVVWANGQILVRHDAALEPRAARVPLGLLRSGRLCLSTTVFDEGPGAWILKLELHYKDGERRRLVTDGNWTSSDEPLAGWKMPGFEATGWGPVVDLGRFGADDLRRGVAQAESIPERNQWIAYRNYLSLSRIPKSYVLRVAVDSRYWLWINGRLVVFEGGLKRGPNPRDTYVDEIEIAHHLVPGENTLAILVWYFGKDGYGHNSSGKPGLFLDSPALRSDASWKAMRHPAFGDTRGKRPNPRLAESNVRYDAQRAIGPWTAATYDDSAWSSAVELGPEGSGPWGALVARPIPPFRFTKVRDYENGARFPQVGTGGVVRGVLPRNLLVAPTLEVEAEAGQVIDVRPDNYTSGSAAHLRAEYVTRAGRQRFECPLAFNGHEVRYRIPEGVRIVSLGYRATSYDTDVVGAFECDDAFYSKLWTKAATTLGLNMRDAMQDPDRERAQWWGDATVVLAQILAVCDGRGRQLIAKGIRNLVDWRKPEGVLYAPVPAGNFHQELPLQMLAAVGPYGIGAYVAATGDLEIAREAYPAIVEYLNLWSVTEAGLVDHRPGDWAWADWGGYHDEHVMEQAWYLLALDETARLARALEQSEDAETFGERAGTLRAAIDAELWDATHGAYRSPEHFGPSDDRANALVVLAGTEGTRDNERRDRLRTLLMEERHASPYMEKYVLEALFVLDAPEFALRRMQQRYAAMVASELTTLWEDWTLDGRPGGGGINHGWAGGPLSLLATHVTGVRPRELGYASFRVDPSLGSLRFVRTRIPTVRGTIRVEVERTDARYEVRLEVPEGSEAHVGLRPAELPANARLAVLGRPWDVADDAPPSAEAARWLGERDGRTVVRVPAGTWTISATAE